MKRKILSVLLMLCMVIGLLPTGIVQVSAAATDSWGDVADTSWYTKTASTYYISTPEQLAGLAYLVNTHQTEFLNQTVYLDADISLAGKEWIPIDWGGWTDQKRGCPSFRGIFDGQNYTISDMTISSTNAAPKSGTAPIGAEEYYAEIGLFGRVDGKVCNVNINNAVIALNSEDTARASAIAILAGMLYKGVSSYDGAENCSVSNSTIKINGNATSGIIHAQTSGSVHVMNCSEKNNSIINISEDDWRFYYDSTLYNSYNSSDIFYINTAEELAAISALASYANKDFSGKTVILKNDLDMSSYKWVPVKEFNGTFLGNGNSISGIVSSVYKIDNSGYSGFIAMTSGCTIENLTLQVNPSDANTPSDYYGCLIAFSNGAVSISNCKIEGSAVNTTYAGGIIGLSKVSAVITSCVVNARISANASAKSCAGGFIGCSEGTANINSATSSIGFYGEVENAAYVGGYIGLAMDEIKINNGCVRTVNITDKCITGNGDNSCAGGFIGKTQGTKTTVIKNSLVYGKVENAQYAGGMIGHSTCDSNTQSTKINCIVSGNGANSNAGGFIGVSEGASHFNNVTFYHRVDNAYHIGGIVGLSSNEVVILNSVSNADLGRFLYGYSVGGFIGGANNNSGSTNPISIQGSHAFGTYGQNTFSYVGGFIGMLYKKAVLTNSYNHAVINGRYNVGGLVGLNESELLSIQSCANRNNVTGLIYVGGLVGMNSTQINIESSYNAGNIEGEIVGGLVGRNTGSGTFHNCINCGNVTGSFGAGGLIGVVRDNCVIDQCAVYQDNILNSGPVTVRTTSTSGWEGGFAAGFVYSIGGENVQIANSYCTAQIAAADDAYALGLFKISDLDNAFAVKVYHSYFGGTLTYEGSENKNDHVFLGFYTENPAAQVFFENVRLITAFYDPNNTNIRNYIKTDLSNESYSGSGYKWFTVHNHGQNSTFNHFNITEKSEFNFVDEMNSASGAPIWSSVNTANAAYQYGMPYLLKNISTNDIANLSVPAAPDSNTAISEMTLPEPVRTQNIIVSGDEYTDLSNLSYSGFSAKYGKADGSAEHPYTTASISTGLTIRIDTYNELQNPLIKLTNNLLSRGDKLTLMSVNADKTGYDATYEYTVQQADIDSAGTTTLLLGNFSNASGTYSPNAGVFNCVYIKVEFSEESKKYNSKQKELCDISYVSGASVGTSTAAYLEHNNISLKITENVNCEFIISDNYYLSVSSTYVGSSLSGIPISIQPAPGYSLNSVEFKQGQKIISYTYEQISNSVVWKESGEWTVSAKLDKKLYSIEYSGPNASLSDENGDAIATDKTITHGDSFKFKITPEDGYRLEAVTVGKQQIIPDANGIYMVNDVQDAVRITANTIKKTDTSITLSVKRTSTQRKLSFEISGLPDDAIGSYSIYSSNSLIGSANIGNSIELQVDSVTNTFSFTAKYSGDFKYNGSTSQAVYIDLGKSDQSPLSFGGAINSSYIYGDSFTVSATGGSGNGAVTYESSDASVATVNKNTGEVKIVSVGSFTITATKAADDNYNETSVTTLQINAGQKEVTITGVTVEDKEYDGTNAATIKSSGTLSGVITGDDISFTVGSCTFDDVNAGKDIGVTATGFTLTGADADNYKLASQPAVASAEIGKACLDVSANPVTINKGQPLPTLTVSVSGFIPGETAAMLTGFEAPDASVNGTVDTMDETIKAFAVSYSGGNPTDNYEFDFSITTAVITINKIPVTDNDYSLSADGTQWQKQDLTLTPANGYNQISTDGNTWQSSLTLSNEGESSVTFYLKKADGTVTESKTISYKLDKTAPTAEIKLGTNSWKAFLNTITFGLCSKQTVDVSVLGADDISKVATIEYQKVAAQSDYDVNGTWVSGNGFSVAPNEKFIVYARVTDNAGNVTIVNSDGVVVYTDSSLEKATAEFNFDIQTDIDVTMKLNDNTLNKIKNGNNALVNGTDYTVNGNTVTIKKEYLSAALTEGSLNLTFSFNPMGEMFGSIPNGGSTENLPLEAVFTVTKHVHTPENDDDDCTTAVECSECHFVTTAAKEHSFKGSWLNDETGHWHTCQNTGCTVAENAQSHSFEWITDKQATTTESGSKHEECSVCGYKKAAVEIPVIKAEQKPSEDKNPETSDNSTAVLLLSLLFAFGCLPLVLVIIKKRKEQN